MHITQLHVSVAHSHGNSELLSFPVQIKLVLPWSVAAKRLEKVLGCAGKAPEVICGAWSEQSLSQAVHSGMAAERWKERARASGAWSDSEGLQAARNKAVFLIFVKAQLLRV